MGQSTFKRVLQSAGVKTLALLLAAGLGFAVLQAVAQSKQLIRVSTPAVPDDWHAKIKGTVFKENLESSSRRI